MKSIYLSIIATCLGAVAYAQEAPAKRRPFVNMTEFGGLFGNVVYDQQQWTSGGNPQMVSQVENRLSFTFQTFNGAQVTPRLAIGGTVGVDWYTRAVMLPLAVGARYDLIGNQQKKVGVFGSLDAGYAFSWLNTDPTNYDTQGGLLLNPGVGLRIGTKSKTAFLITLSYKRQDAKVTKPLQTNDVERYEDRVYNRMAFRIGVQF